MSVIDNLFSLRQNFILIGLTGRTGSGCTTVAGILSKEHFDELPTDYPYGDSMTNDARKNRIVYEYISRHWKPFISIKASDVIFFYALLQTFDVFKECFCAAGLKSGKSDNGELENARRAQISQVLDPLKDDFDALHELASDCDNFLKGDNIPDATTDEQYERYSKYLRLILFDIPRLRLQISEALKQIDKDIISHELQKWGTNIRLYDSIKENANLDELHKEAPACLAIKTSCFVKILRRCLRHDDKPELIVNDALRNPFEVLYFRERYSGFYTMSVNTTDTVRHENLYRQGYTHSDIEDLEENEKSKNDVRESFSGIDVDRCIELSDIHLTHDGTPADRNKSLVLQILTYIALIKHPGLVPPSPQERLMQVAFTARLNSGCLSRQVGAAVTDKNFSLKSIDWNTAPAGQTPCTLRSLVHLHQVKDDNAFSNYERTDTEFKKRIARMYRDYMSPVKEYDPAKIERLQGLNLGYCFKDVYTDLYIDKHGGNQVHTRSLHAEENAFLQLAKYGTAGIEGGYLFTTASCCELCGKKAYQLRIRRIYYIDTYPGITRQHILECSSQSPEVVLFNGAIGRAYVSLYNPILPQKDEIEALTGVKVKYNKTKRKNEILQQDKPEGNGDNNNDKTEG